MNEAAKTAGTWAAVFVVIAAVYIMLPGLLDFLRMIDYPPERIEQMLNERSTK